MEYFQVVCAKEFALLFELPLWETVVLQAASVEPAIYHAALAFACLSRNSYHPTTRQVVSHTCFAMRQYGLAIRAIQSRLDRSSRSLELAILASIVFAAVESFFGIDSKIDMHVRAGLSISRSVSSPSALQCAVGRISPSAMNAACLAEDSLYNLDLLRSGISQLGKQVDSFIAFQPPQPRISPR